jgi:hypothetical protein
MYLKEQMSVHESTLDLSICPTPTHSTHNEIYKSTERDDASMFEVDKHKHQTTNSALI